MYCKICGATLAPGEVFCKNCGASNTNMAAEPAVPNVAPIPQNPITSDSGPMPPNEINPGLAPTPFPEPVNVEPPKPMEEVNNPAENSTEKPEKKDSGKFLIVIGVIVGLLATAVIAYLIYSTLKSKNANGGGADVTVVTQTNYSVVFANHTFMLKTNVNSLVNNKLELTAENWQARIWSSGNPEFSKITNDNLKKAFEAVTDYKIGEISSKTYDNLNCFETNVDYTDGTKTLLLLCNRPTGGYWAIEIGTKSYTAYPTSDIANEVVSLVANAKRFENGTDSKLKIGEINITAGDVPTTTASE